MAYGALGGGGFTVQNKVLPGTYTKMISQPGITQVWKDRGYGAIALDLSWGEENGIVTITNERLMNNCEKLFGCDFTDPELKPIRDIMKGAKVLHLYNLNNGGTKATLKLGTLTVTAKYPGKNGNKLAVAIEEDVNREGFYRIETYLDGILKDEQAIDKLEDFDDNGFITLSGSLSETSVSLRSKLEGGDNGTVKAGAHGDFLSKIQGEYFNVIAYAGTDESIKGLYEQFVKTMVYEAGYMCQLVLHRAKVNDRFISNVCYDSVGSENMADSVFWYFGQSAGVELGKSVSAVIYNGEYDIETLTDTYDATSAIEKGQLKMIKTDGEIKLLEDINSFTNFSKELTEDWALNEVVRIVMQRVQNISMLFNKYYMHKELNDDIGRNKLWADVAYDAKERFQNQLRIIENYTEEDTRVTKGEQKGGVVIYDAITPVVTMSKLYLTVAIA